MSSRGRHGCLSVRDPVGPTGAVGPTISGDSESGLKHKRPIFVSLLTGEGEDQVQFGSAGSGRDTGERSGMNRSGEVGEVGRVALSELWGISYNRMRRPQPSGTERAWWGQMGVSVRTRVLDWTLWSRIKGGRVVSGGRIRRGRKESGGIEGGEVG